MDGDGNYSDIGTGEYNDERTYNDVNELTARDIDDDGSDDQSITYDAAGNLTDDGDAYAYVYDAFGRLRSITESGGSPVYAEFRYNGLGYKISELLDTNDSGEADENDKWFHTAYDEDWRELCTYRENDTSPKTEYINHNAGLDGFGGSSYLDGLIQRRRDTSEDWATEPGDGTYEEKLYYCQSWRHDVAAIVDFRGFVHEWVKYSAYGIPFGLPGGDDDVSGSTDIDDINRIQNRITGGWEYSVLADIDLDGDVDSDDKNAVTAKRLDGRSIGYGALSSETISNCRGWGGLPTIRAELYLARNRVMHTELGRWLSRDPAGYLEGASLYGVVVSNPVRWVDPYGLQESGASPAQESAKASAGGMKKFKFKGGTMATTMKSYAQKTIRGMSGMKGHIIFKANKDCPPCKTIRFIQIVRGTKSGENESAPPGANPQEAKKAATKEDKKAGVKGGFVVDGFISDGSTAPSVYYGSHTESARAGKDTPHNAAGSSGKKRKQAVMWDAPGSNYSRTVEFETCAVCADDGSVFGCITWGFTTKGDHKGNKDTVTGYNPTSSPTPSPTFNKAVENYNSYLESTR